MNSYSILVLTLCVLVEILFLSYLGTIYNTTFDYKLKLNNAYYQTRKQYFLLHLKIKHLKIFKIQYKTA